MIIRHIVMPRKTSSDLKRTRSMNVPRFSPRLFFKPVWRASRGAIRDANRQVLAVSDSPKAWTVAFITQSRIPPPNPGPGAFLTKGHFLTKYFRGFWRPSPRKLLWTENRGKAGAAKTAKGMGNVKRALRHSP